MKNQRLPYIFLTHLNSTIYQYHLKNFKEKILIKFKKNQGFPDGLALDNKEWSMGRSLGWRTDFKNQS